MDFILTINATQLRNIMLAAELWSRVGTGELTALLNHPDIQKRLTTDDGVTTEDVRRLLEGLKQAVFGLSGGAYFGIVSDEIGESNRVAYDMVQMIRKALHKEGQPEVTVLQTSTEPLPEIREKPNDPV